MHTYQFTTQGVALHDAQRAIILIHGRGAPPEDILGLADFFDDGKTWFAAPEANNYTWYPYSFLTPKEQNQPWLDSALENIERLIQETEKQIPAHNIFIMGFSQGACLTSEVTSRNARKYGGIAIFTGGLIGDNVDESVYHGNFNGAKVYISNGDNDPHIPLSRTNETYDLMKKLGADVVKEVFPGRPHTIQKSEIEKVKTWLLGM
jgi:phospholipase/carboxylesterase